VQEKRSQWGRLSAWLLLSLLALSIGVFGATMLKPQPALGAGNGAQQCPTGEHKNAAGVCIANTGAGATGLNCPAGEVPGPQGKQCVNACPTGESLSPSGQCVATQTSCTAGEILQDGRCVAKLACPTNAHQTGNTCACEPGFNESHTANGELKCIIACPDGQHADGSGACVANGLNCPAGEVPGPQGKQCVEACATGQTLAANGQCVATQTSCASGEILQNGRCVAKLACPANSHQAGVTCACAAGFKESHTADGQLKCIVACPDGQHADASGAACVANGLHCPAGQVPGPKGLLCVPAACPTGQHVDPVSGACAATTLQCPAGEKPGPNGLKCVAN
jgi:hypothetical protein